MKRTFAIKKFLNPKDHPSTGTICAYHGASHWGKREEETYLSIGDCHVNARLHTTDKDGIKDFIKKLKIIRKVVDEFICFLESLDLKATK
jgi:hypothetical protein